MREKCGHPILLGNKTVVCEITIKIIYDGDEFEWENTFRKSSKSFLKALPGIILTISMWFNRTVKSAKIK